MKTILIKILVALTILSLSWINYVWSTYAATEPSKTGSGIKVTVTEKIPWVWCEKITNTKDKDWNVIKWEAKEWETQMYECTVEKGFGSITTMLGKIIKYFTYIAALAWVLYIVINGILYSMWWVNDSFKTESKERIITTLKWLIILMLSWIILNAVAPWIYTG